MQVKRYKVAKELPFIPVGGEISYDSKDNKYHYGYFTIPAELIEKTEFFEEIPRVESNTTVIEDIEELIEQAKELRTIAAGKLSEASNKIGHYRKQMSEQKHIQNVRMIEGIFNATCELMNITDIEMQTSANTIQFALLPECKKKTPLFQRVDLEVMPIPKLTGTIVAAVKSLKFGVYNSVYLP